MLPALGTNPIGINIDATIGNRHFTAVSTQTKCCVITVDKVIDWLFYFTRVWGLLTATVMGGVGVDFIYHGRVPGYWIIAYAVATFVGETLWVITLFVKLTIRIDHRFWRIWKYIIIIDDWKKTPIYIFFGFMTMYKPYKLWLVYLAGGASILLGIFHLMLSILKSLLARRIRKKKNRHNDLDSLDSSKLDDATAILDDTMPEPIPGSSVSLSDSLNPEQDSILEI